MGYKRFKQKNLARLSAVMRSVSRPPVSDGASSLALLLGADLHPATRIRITHIQKIPHCSSSRRAGSNNSCPSGSSTGSRTHCLLEPEGGRLWRDLPHPNLTPCRPHPAPPAFAECVNRGRIRPRSGHLKPVPGHVRLVSPSSIPPVGYNHGHRGLAARARSRSI